MKLGLQNLDKQGGIPIPNKPGCFLVSTKNQLKNGPKQPWLRHSASNLDLLEYDLSLLLQQNLLRSPLLRNSLLQELKLMRLLKEMKPPPFQLQHLEAQTVP